jgi:hypothetical protein
VREQTNQAARRDAVLHGAVDNETGDRSDIRCMTFLCRSLIPACAAAALPLLACKVYDPLYCDAKTECSDPDRPFCDLAGEYPASDGVPQTCIADPNPADDGGSDDDGDGDDGAEPTFCTAGEFLQCTDGDSAIYCNERGTEFVTVECGAECDPDRQGCFCEPDTSSCSDDQTIHCDIDGQVKEIEACALGCNDTGERCVDVVPSNGLAGYLDMTDDAPVVVLSNGAVIDTDAGTIEDGDGTPVDAPQFQVTAAPGGVPVRVFAVKSLVLGDAIVSGSRGLAVVSDGDISVGGHVHILAGASTEGSCVGEVGGRELTGCEWCGALGGAGGGGFGQRGGDGGQAMLDDALASGGVGGSTTGESSLVPLRGGCSGGGINPQLPLGGDGGGAVHLVSRTLIRIEDGSGEGHLDAGGKAGNGANDGGGSGGGILLEAPRVVVASGAWRVLANGAGGSGGCGTTGAEDGSVTSMPALGGGQGCTNPVFGKGGNGGAKTHAPTSGEAASGPDPNIVMGGGGGGGAGRIRVNVPAFADFMGSTGTSPGASVGTLTTR